MGATISYRVYFTTTGEFTDIEMDASSIFLKEPSADDMDSVQLEARRQEFKKMSAFLPERWTRQPEELRVVGPCSFVFMFNNESCQFVATGNSVDYGVGEIMRSEWDRRRNMDFNYR